MSGTISGRSFVGLLFIVVGAILLLRFAGISLPVDIPSYLISWQMILVVLGIYFMTTRENKNTGLILLLIGGVFLARDIFSIPIRDFIRMAIPVILLIAGVALLFPRRWFKKKDVDPLNETGDGNTSGNRAFFMFSDGKRHISSEDTMAGEVTCIFGGADVFFDDTQQKGVEKVLYVSCIFAGCDIHVPDGWTVNTAVTSLFAGVDDKRKIAAHGDNAAGNTLTIRGTLLFSGLDIKQA